MKGWSKNTTYIAVGMLVGGFLLLVLGWNGAAGIDYVPGQLPYVISGGLAGMGLIAGGLALVVVQELRRATVEISAKLEEMSEIVASGVGTGPTAVPSDGDRIVAGRTSYHRPDCRLIASRADLQVMSPDAARERGLAPCRICEPKTDAVA